VTRSMAASATGAAIALTLWLGAQAAYTAFMCPPHLAWTRAHSGQSGVVLERSERVARPGDAIFLCEAPHRSGPVLWHMDLNCYCAPASLSAADVGQKLGGTCSVDKPHPLRSDAAGACRYARCGAHLE
jgi:hypothetical protein